MFPRRYYPADMFAPRYFPQSIGIDGGTVCGELETTVRTTGTLSVTNRVTATLSITPRVTGTLSFEDC